MSKAYVNQLKISDNYLRLRPANLLRRRCANAVTIVDFVLFQDKKAEDVISKFVFQEQDKKFEYPDAELQLFFVELPKFKKDLAELSSLIDKWIYFLKEAAQLEEIPATLGEVSEIELALNIANQAGMTEEELDLVDRRGMMLQDEKGRIDYAAEEGERQGMQKGVQKGEARLIIRLLKKRFGEIPAALSSKIEDLSIEDLEPLAEDIFDFNSLEDLSGWLEERKPS